MDAWQEFVGRHPATFYVLDAMLVTKRLQPGISQPSIGDHQGARSDRLCDERTQTLRRGVCNALQSDTAYRFSALLCCHHDNRLILGFPTVDIFFWRSNEGFIYLHRAAEPVSPGTNHGAPDLVKPGPGRLVAPQSQHPLQAKGTGSMLLARHKPNGEEPVSKWLACAFKQGSRGDRNLAPAASAVHMPPRCDPGIIVYTTTRTLKTIAPPQTDKIVPTMGLAAEPRLELLKRSWIVNTTFGSMSLIHLPILHLGVTCAKWIPTYNKFC